MKILAKSPLRKNIRCDLYDCGCRVNSFIWVNHRKKVIYFESPKTACSSIKKALGIRINILHVINSFFKQKRIGNGPRIKFDLSIFKLIANLRFTNWEMIYNELEIKKYSNDYYCFGVKRDELSRLKSNYRMFCGGSNQFRTKQIKFFLKKENEIEFCNAVLEKNNHHWEPLNKYFMKNINLIDIHELNQFWSNFSLKYNFDRLQRENVSRRIKIINKKLFQDTCKKKYNL